MKSFGRALGRLLVGLLKMLLNFVVVVALGAGSGLLAYNYKHPHQKVLAAQAISSRKLSVQEGSTGKLYVNNTNHYVSYSSSDENVAKVRFGNTNFPQTAVVYGIQPGKAIVTAVTEGHTCKCIVTVTKKPVKVNLQDYISIEYDGKSGHATIKKMTLDVLKSSDSYVRKFLKTVTIEQTDGPSKNISNGDVLKFRLNWKQKDSRDYYTEPVSDTASITVNGLSDTYSKEELTGKMIDTMNVQLKKRKDNQRYIDTVFYGWYYGTFDTDKNAHVLEAVYRKADGTFMAAYLSPFDTYNFTNEKVPFQTVDGLYLYSTTIRNPAQIERALRYMSHNDVSYERIETAEDQKPAPELMSTQADASQTETEQTDTQEAQ